MSPDSSLPGTAGALARENEALRQQLQEAEDLIAAIRTGTIDALAVQGADGPRIFTLEGADQTYRTLIEQMNEGALLLGQDATILYCNACLAGLLAAPLHTLMGFSFNRFVPAEAEAYWAELMAAGWAGKSRGEMILRDEDGRLRPFALALNVLSFGDARMVAVIATDVSAHREISAIRAQVAEQNAQLERQQEALRAQAQAVAETSRILEGLPHIAWTASPEGKPSYLNLSWYNYTGQSTTVHFEKNSTLSYLHPDDLPEVMRRWRECLGSGRDAEVESRIRDAQGNYRWMLGRIRPSHNEVGELVQWIGTYTDIHEHKLALDRIDQAQRELRENNQQLTRVNIDLDNFIYTASHDLRAPITNIEGLLDTLRQELPEDHRPAEVTSVLEMMQDSVDRFKRTIGYLTDISKLQKENTLPNGPVNLQPVIEDVCQDLQPLIRAVGGRLSVAIEACPTVYFAEKNLRSVVYNLLSNAFKYHAPDRPCQVSIRCRPAASGYTALEVQDNGLGLNMSGEQKLFGMFQRLHDHVEGSGIGLYMVKKMVENAGGRIEVNSQLHQGSTFTVFLPAPAGGAAPAVLPG
ncbi:sensor histidine kinase [Hymenobacter rubripertinctus]|uniref:histidine kinase n=1 Tax=Hymenobacter rubripertinctus TaxID=2029981 RepID=A0A418QZX2_9BACT|nr:ATP-binding protein [Hymenobacter rubripertinctus]RIY10750.1 PAS domain S-box protein [Hymenobacter rubripertinctus]